MASTLHTCDYIAPSWYSTCDRNGCQENAYNANSKGMCPDSSCTINTSQPFTMSHTQSESSSGGNMTNVNIYMQQGNNNWNFNVCNNIGYDMNMGYSLSGIVFVASLWTSSDMSWLDGVTGCQGSCDLANSQVTFSNFQLESINDETENSTTPL
jgi:hypothetical protein